jgi:hypothetical protein
VLRIRIWIRIGFGRLDSDPDPGGQKLPTKIEKKEISCFEVSAESFSCILDVLRVDLGMYNCKFFIQTHFCVLLLQKVPRQNKEKPILHIVLLASARKSLTFHPESNAALFFVFVFV